MLGKTVISDLHDNISNPIYTRTDSNYSAVQNRGGESMLRSKLKKREKNPYERCRILYLRRVSGSLKEILSGLVFALTI